MTDKRVPVVDLEFIKWIAVERGYRFETDEDGTVRMYREDGTLALTAKPAKHDRSA